jgi:DNA-binding MurR/RpiR family transcriptional regulator
MAKSKKKTGRKSRGLHGTFADHSAGFEREVARAEQSLKLAASAIEEERCQGAADRLFDAERRFFSAMVENEYSGHKSMSKLSNAVDEMERKFKKVCVR